MSLRYLQALALATFLFSSTQGACSGNDEEFFGAPYHAPESRNNMDDLLDLFQLLTGSQQQQFPQRFENSPQIEEHCATFLYNGEELDIYSKDLIKVLVKYPSGEEKDMLFSGKGLQRFLEDPESENFTISVIEIYEDMEDLESKN